MIIGVVAGCFRFWACTALKLRCKYDDSLDVFGVHGIGGVTGTLLCGVFAAASVSISPANPAGLPGLLEGHPQQVLTQLYGVIVTAGWCGVATFALLRLVGIVRYGPRRRTRWPGSTFRCMAKHCNRFRFAGPVPNVPRLHLSD
jgi:ammonium transporter, Amt family